MTNWSETYRGTVPPWECDVTEHFTIADAYLAVVTNWLQATPIKLADYPNLQAHQARVFSRPAAGKAVAEEAALYRQAA